MQKSEKCYEKFQTFFTLFVIMNYKRMIDKGVETMPEWRWIYIQEVAG